MATTNPMTGQIKVLTTGLGAFACAVTVAGCAPQAPFERAAVEARIVTVRQWGGTPADASMARKHSVTRITLHHQGEAFPRERHMVEYLRSLQSWSRETQNWVDIPYHYLIDLDGNIYEGRPIGLAGDTNTEYDPAGHALVEVVGNYEVAEPNQSQLDAVVEVMTLLAAKYAIGVEAISGHRDLSRQTVCPGKNLYRYLQNGYFRERVGANLRSRSGIGWAAILPGSS